MSRLGHLKRRLLTAFGAAAALACVPTLAHAEVPPLSTTVPKPAYPAFYIPPSPLPPGKPGDLIRWQEMSFSQAITKPRKYTRGYMIMYRSTSATGEPIAVTGTVLIPNERPTQGVANRPIISYGNEAQGLGDQCAVSRLMRFGHTGEIALTDPMLARGYAVASSDYEGLGTPAVHTFGVTESASRTMLDIVRAARQLTAAKLPPNGPVALFGYSQGGAAVGGAAEIQPSYAPDVELTAAALGGPPIEPISFAQFNDGGPFASVNFAAAAGYDAAYSELNLEEFLNDEGRAAMKNVYNSCIESIFSLAFKKSADTTTKSIFEDPRWIERFRQNTLGSRAPKVPTYFFHAQNDEASPFTVAQRLRRQWCGQGANLQWVPVPFFDHVFAGPYWMPTAAKWVADRIDGKPTTGNCGGYAPSSSS